MTKKAFDEVVLFARTGLNPRTNFKLGNGNNKYITIKNIHNNRLVVDENTDLIDDEALGLIHKRSQIKEGDILFCSIGRLGDMYIIPNEPKGWDINESVFAFTVDTNLIRQKYFYYLFKNRDTIEYLSKNSSGSTFKSIKMNQLKKMVFELPSLSEQDQIVDTLDLINNIIEKRQNELARLDELIKARFVEMFGDPESDNKYPQIAVKDFTDVVSGGTPDRKNKEYWEEGTVPWVKTTELQNNRIIDVEEKITEKGLSESSAKMVPKDTILIAMYGQGKTRGMTAILGIPASTNQACACLLPSENVIPEYLWQYMIMSYDRLRSLAQGGNQPNLNGNMIKNFTVLMPPKEKQMDFVDFVKQVDKSKVEVQKVLERTQFLFDSLMQKYFGG